MNLNGLDDFHIHYLYFTSNATDSRTLNTDVSRTLYLDAKSGDPKIENNSSATHTFNVPIVLNNWTQLNPVNGDLIFSGTINMNSNNINVYGENSKMITFSGALSGTGKFIVSQYSKVKFSTNHSYSGNTEINKGELWIATSGDAIASGSTIYLGDGGALGNIAKIFLSKSDGGATFSRTININNGNVSTRFLGGTNSSGTNTFSAAISITSSSPLNLEAATAGGTINFDGIISGTSGAITTLGAGIVKLSAANSYTGTTTIASGTLQLGASGVIPDASNVVLNGGTLSTGASSGYSETAGSLTLSSSSTISFGTGSHTLTFAASNATTWSGTLTISNWSSTGAKLYVGNDASGLTSTQLGNINFTGFGTGAQILSSGEVIPAAYLSTTTGSWSTGGSWVGNSSPTSGANIIIQNGHTITLDANASINSLTINTGGMFTATDGSPRTLTLTRSSSGHATTVSNSGTWSNGTGTSTVVFTGAPGSGDAIHDISGTIAFQNITVNKTGGANNVGASFGANSSVSGTLEIGSGGFISTAPPTSFYGSAAILKFNQGTGATYDVNATDNSWSTTVIPQYITISSGTVNLKANRTATGNLLIDGGALVLVGAVNLTIERDWTRSSGTFTAGTGTVTLSGSSSSTVYVTGAASMNNLVISKSSANVNLSSEITVANLTISSGSATVTSGESLTVTGTLTNSAGNSGLIIASGGSLIQSSASVAATVQRTINGWGDVNHGWHLLSSPVAAQAINSEFTTVPSNEYDFYTWSEPDNLWVNFKNETTSPKFSEVNGSANFIVGKGYLVEYLTSSTKQFTGTLNKDIVTFTNLTHSAGTNHGWHLLGNPFPSAITWGTGDWSLSGITATAKVWDETNAQYLDVAANSGIIPALNGFMVEVTSGTNSITIPILARTHSTQAWYKESAAPSVILVARDAAGNTAQQSIVQFMPEATTGFDQLYDSHFLSGYAPKFYSVAGSEQLSTNALPESGGTVQIPFSFVKNENTSFSIEATTISNLYGPVILNDLKTGASQDLSQNPSYSFTSQTGDDPARFLLTFNHVGVGDPQKLNGCKIYASGQNIIISGDELQNDGVVCIYNIIGQRICKQEFTGDKMLKINLEGQSGYYLVKVVTGFSSQTEKVFIK